MPFSPTFALPGPGDVVSDKYRIEKLLAEGGMGIVYEATHLQLDEKVAIKFLRAEFMGPQAGELPGRFLREARMSSKIKSEHVVRVHDVGSTDAGGPYIVMEFLTGEDLDQKVSHHGVLSIPDAIDYVLQACEALAEAHAIGIVHRDLKPANLFLIHRADGSPCVKVLDFGISKFQDGAGNTRDFGMTKTHAVLGSPSYMSPEQMRSSKDVDARADIWAIGIILYELLAGTVPFDGDSMPQICAAILEQTPKSIRAMRPEITEELENIVLKCLAKNADDRFANVAVLAQALSPWGSSEAWASADRIARVLGVSGPDEVVDTTPDPPTKSISVPPPTPLVAPAPLMRIVDSRSAADASGAEVAWAGLDMVNPRVRQRRIGIIAAALALLIVAGLGAKAALFIKHRENPVETTAAVLHRQTPSQPARAVLTLDLPAPPPSALAVDAPAMESATEKPSAAPAPITNAKSTKPSAKHATSHAAAPHSPAPHVESHVDTPHVDTPRSVSPPATQAPQPVSQEDMWDERK